MSSNTDNLLKQIRQQLEAVHGSRLKGVILYGSEARGQAGPDSDIDLLVLLEGPVQYGLDLEKNLQALHPLAMELSRRISAKPVSMQEYRTADCPLYRRAREEGIAA